MVADYQRGDSLAAICNRYRYSKRITRAALVAAGVRIRGRGIDETKKWRHTSDRCRACGILLAKAGCGHHDGVCDECWKDVAKLARLWGLDEGQALERWLEETTQKENCEAELGEWCSRILERKKA